MTPAELKRELAVYLFQQGKLSFGKAREMADMSAWDFQFVLGSRNIPVHYDLLISAFLMEWRLILASPQTVFL